MKDIPDWSSLKGADAISLIDDALACDFVTTSQLEKILYKLGYVDCVYAAFYPALNLLLDIIENQPEQGKHELLCQLARWVLFAVEQENHDCPPNFAANFSEALIRFRELAYQQLCKKSIGKGSLQSLLIGLCASLREPESANAIRDIDC